MNSICDLKNKLYKKDVKEVYVLVSFVETDNIIILVLSIIDRHEVVELFSTTKFLYLRWGLISIEEKNECPSR